MLGPVIGSVERSGSKQSLLSRRLAACAHLVSLVLTVFGCARVTSQEASSRAGDEVVPCTAEVHPLRFDEPTELGFRAEDLRPLLTQSHSAVLTWATGATTRISTKLLASDPEFVQKRANPDYAANHPAPQCSNFMRFRARIELSTTDGALREQIEPVMVEATSPHELRAEFALPRAALVGKHAPILRSACLVSVRFRLLFAIDGSHGLLNDRLRRGSCDAARGPLMDFAGGRWGQRWLH